MTENPPWRRLCSALRNHPTALPALSVTQFAHTDGLDLSGARKMWSRCCHCAALHWKGSSSVLFLSTKTWNVVSGKLLEVQMLVAPCYCGNYEFYRHLLELCWYGQSRLRLLLLHALCFASPHTIWRSCCLVGFPRDAISLKVRVNLLSGILSAHLSF